jgi:hypothetical protein
MQGETEFQKLVEAKVILDSVIWWPNGLSAYFLEKGTIGRDKYLFECAKTCLLLIMGTLEDPNFVTHPIFPGLSNRIAYSLERGGYLNIEMLEAASDLQLLSVNNIGRRRVQEIRRWLNDRIRR